MKAWQELFLFSLQTKAKEEQPPSKSYNKQHPQRAAAEAEETKRNISERILLRSE